MSWKKSDLKRAVKTKKVKEYTTKSSVDNSITKKYCPFFKEKCKGLNCAFGDEKMDFGLFYGNKKVLYCKLFEGLTGKLKFDIETSIKQEED